MTDQRPSAVVVVACVLALALVAIANVAIVRFVGGAA
jgi:hypothetical protein